MGEWLALSKEDEMLFRSCDESENIVLLDDRWVKMPTKSIVAMFVDCYMRSTEDALKKLDVAYEITTGIGKQGIGYRFHLKDGRAISGLDYDHDLESGYACATVTLDDDRQGKGFAKIKRTRPN